MTVDELIEALSKFDKESYVYVEHEGWHDYDLDVYERDFSDIWEVVADGDEVVIDAEYRHDEYGRMGWPGKRQEFLRKQNDGIRTD